MLTYRTYKTLIFCGIIMFLATGCRNPTITSPTDPITIDAGDSISFTAGTYTGAIYMWTFDGGATDRFEKNPTVQFNTPGVYDVCLVVVFKNLNSGCAFLTVTVNDPSTTVYTLTENSYEITRDTTDDKKVIWVVEKDGAIVMRRSAQGESSYTHYDNATGEYRIWLARFNNGVWSEASNIVTYSIP